MPCSSKERRECRLFDDHGVADLHEGSNKSIERVLGAIDHADAFSIKRPAATKFILKLGEHRRSCARLCLGVGRC